MSHIHFPFALDETGKTALATADEHCFGMIVQFLLTGLGERVNRPDFGTPLARLCFEGNSEGLAEVIQFAARAGVERWLGDLIEIVELNASAVEATLVVELKYRVRGEAELKSREQRIPMTSGAML